jgi:NAD(P)-dependent dehydrogenase (short-subunit alcohol dehydrogenase family)
MASICITGSTDGIGLAATRRLLADGHSLVVHARSEERGQKVLADLTGDVRLVVGDLADLDQVRALAEQIGAVDVLVHNAGISTPPAGDGGLEQIFVVNSLAPHLLTALLAVRIERRLVFLGSGMVARGTVDPDRLGTARSQGQAYADSKAVDVALGLGWGRRLPHLLAGAVDPGWVKTKLAGDDAPGDVESGGARVALAAADPSWRGGYTAGARPARTPDGLTDPRLQDALLDALDRLAGLA